MGQLSKPQVSLLVHFAACLLIAFFGAALATGFPFLPDDDYLAREIWWLQICAIASACVTSLITAFVLRSSDGIRRGSFVRYFACLFAVLVANHFIWVEPIWGFRHTYTLGICAWLVIDFEGGLSIFPYFGLPFTVLFYALLNWLVISLPMYRPLQDARLNHGSG